ncbi:ferric iron reductase [Paenibacillus taichungensis]|uniref:ferric iron reductase n=1 Tax=Paenibacillus taichungensis TaxID=484184 RepID=UPI002DBB751F|nr:ferric iron reductase [Paenibacillus taichungensis]MEC0109879.1 ferric iron reductase [Paenibacillus taichungensis]MEC0198205.1 ferric iron reductase [Paenibacillus taichungensis]
MGAINYTWLQQYGRITTGTIDESVFGMPLTALKHPKQAKLMLEAYNEHLRADSLRSAAVYFMHSVRGLMIGVHYMTALCDTYLDLSLENIDMKLELKDGRPVIGFQLNNTIEQSHPNLMDGSQVVPSSWRNDVLTAYYGEQLRPLIEGVAVAGGANPGQMWAQLASMLRWFKTTALQMNITETEREAVIQGYEHVIAMSPEILGLKKNLLTFKPVEIDNPHQPGETMLMKPVCCLHHQVYGGQNYCYSCPKLTKAERQERYDAIMAAKSG